MDRDTQAQQLIDARVSRALPAEVATQETFEHRFSDFFAYLPQHRYLHVPTRDLWPAESVNGHLPWPIGGDLKPIKPASWLDRHRAIGQLVWAPGEPEVIEGRVMDQGGWIRQQDTRVFNLYRPPVIVKGNAHAAMRWRDHLHCLFGDDAVHAEQWLAFKIQNAGVKVNHALVLGGTQGIGKDTLLEPIKAAVGHWNWSEINPSQMLGRFNGWAKAVVVRVSEARDLGEVDRYAFYEHAKVYTAAPPDVLRVDEKNLREHYVANVCGVIITTNHRTAGIYLPPDDRRHFVLWSNSTKEDFEPEYWTSMWTWYENGGLADVATYLRGLNLSGFDPKAPPPKTEAWQTIVHCNIADDDAELAGMIAQIGTPDVVTVEELREAARNRQLTSVSDFLTDRRTKRQVPHALERAGYVPCINQNAADGRWKIGMRRETVYAKSTLSRQEAHALCTAKMRANP